METVIFNLSVLSSSERLEEAIADVDPRASNKYLIELNNQFTSGQISLTDYMWQVDRFYDLRCRVLEEVEPQYKDGISFSDIYDIQPGMESLLKILNQLAATKKLFGYYYYVTERERQEKFELIKKHIPNCTGIIPIPYYTNDYSPNTKRVRTSAIEVLKKEFGDELSECCYIDKKDPMLNQTQLEAIKLGCQTLIVDYDPSSKEYFLRKPRLAAFDVDDTMYPAVERIEREFQKINNNATEQYLRRLVMEKGGTEEYQSLYEEFVRLKDQILEEKGRYEGQKLIDYNYVYAGEFFPGAIHNVVSFITGGYDIVVAITHYNVDRELKIKTAKVEAAVNDELEKTGKKYQAALFEVIGVQYHVRGTNEVTSKFEVLSAMYPGIDYEHDAFIVDNSGRVVADWEGHDGFAIRFVEGITFNIEKNQTGTLDPRVIQLLRSVNGKRFPALLPPDEDATLDGHGAYVKK